MNPGDYRILGKDCGLGLIVDERLRQIREEGFSPEHDDAHVNGEISAAAKCYVGWARQQAVYPNVNFKAWEMPHEWPWEPEWWKPSDDPIKNLKRAGALIAAEIDRLKRKASR